MIDHDYDPYEHLLAMEQALENQAYAIESLGRRMRQVEFSNSRLKEINATTVRALESAYQLIQILENKIKEIQNEKTEGRALR